MATDKQDPRKSTQAHLQVAEIRDGVLITKDGSLKTVLLASSINFDLKSSREQAGIELGFQAFINSLNFDIQIVIRSRRIDLDAYIAKLTTMMQQQLNPLLQELTADYVQNIKYLIEEANIMDKDFYVVVPYRPFKMTPKGLVQALKPAGAEQNISITQTEFEQYKNELLQRTEIVAGGLAQIGVRSIQLKTQELIELFYSIYNPDLAQTQKLANIAELATPVVARQQATPTPGEAVSAASVPTPQPQPQPAVTSPQPASPVPTPQPQVPSSPQPAPAAQPDDSLPLQSASPPPSQGDDNGLI